MFHFEGSFPGAGGPIFWAVLREAPLARRPRIMKKWVGRGIINLSRPAICRLMGANSRTGKGWQAIVLASFLLSFFVEDTNEWALDLSRRRDRNYRHYR